MLRSARRHAGRQAGVSVQAGNLERARKLAGHVAHGLSRSYASARRNHRRHNSLFNLARANSLEQASAFARELADALSRARPDDPGHARELVSRLADAVEGMATLEFEISYENQQAHRPDAYRDLPGEEWFQMLDEKLAFARELVNARNNHVGDRIAQISSLLDDLSTQAPQESDHPSHR